MIGGTSRYRDRRRSVWYLVQESVVSGAGQRGKWSKSDLMVVTGAPKMPRIAILGAGQ